ncbi:hypothetical protein CYMTET_15517, partial [Cymbomonas tetramitiformis]
VCDDTLHLVMMTWTISAPMALSEPCGTAGRPVRLRSRHGEEIAPARSNGINRWISSDPCEACQNHAIVAANEKHDFHHCAPMKGSVGSCPDDTIGDHSDFFLDTKGLAVNVYDMRPGEFVSLTFKRMEDPYLFSEGWYGGEGSTLGTFSVTRANDLQELSHRWVDLDLENFTAEDGAFWHYAEAPNRFTLSMTTEVERYGETFTARPEPCKEYPFTCRGRLSHHLARHHRPHRHLPAPPPYGVFYWSDISTWISYAAMTLSADQYTESNITLPQFMDVIEIPRHWTLVIDTHTAILRQVSVEGVLAFDNETETSLSAYEVNIRSGGELTIGTPEVPHPQKVNITLYGNQSAAIDWYNLHTHKSIAVEGGGKLQIVGRQCPTVWAKIAVTASAQSSTVAVVAGPGETAESTCWTVGDEVVITTSSYSGADTENRRLTQVVMDNEMGTVTLHLDRPLDNEHLGLTTLEAHGHRVVLAAEVGRLTRDIVIQGANYWPPVPSGHYPPEDQEPFQARIVTLGSDKQIWLHGVRFRQVGWSPVKDSYWGTMADFSISGGGGLELRAAHGAVVSQCTFEGTANSLLSVYTSKDVNITENVLFGGNQGGLLLSNSATYAVVRNLVIGGGDYCIVSDVHAPFLRLFTHVRSADYVASTIVGNVAVGCWEYGFLLKGESCDGGERGSPLHDANEAHACGYGYALYGMGCTEVTRMTTWRNQRGIHNWGISWSAPARPNTEDTIGSDYTDLWIMHVVLVQNEDTGLWILNSHDGGAARRLPGLTTTISDSFVVGGFQGEGESGAYSYASVGITIPVYKGGWYQNDDPTDVSGCNGLSTFFGNYHNYPYSTCAIRDVAGQGPQQSYEDVVYATTYINRTVFMNFDQGGAAIMPVRHQFETTHTLKVSDSIFDAATVDEGNRIRLHQTLHSRCGGPYEISCCLYWNCDAHKHVLILDDGSILGGDGGSIISQWDSRDDDFESGVFSRVKVGLDGNTMSWDSIIGGLDTHKVGVFTTSTLP